MEKERNRQPGVRMTLEVGDETPPLEAVKGIAEFMRGIESGLRANVDRARAAGHSWKEIGDALGVTRQSAWEKFGPNREMNDAIEAAFGAFADRPGPSSEEMRKIARLEEEEIEDRKTREGH